MIIKNNKKRKKLTQAKHIAPEQAYHAG